MSAQKPAPLTEPTADNAAGPLFAAIDVGSNNLRLLIATVNQHGEPQVVDAFSRSVRLGAHLNQQGHLRQEALGKAIDALRICASKIRKAGVRAQRAVATETCRRANNRREFVERALRQAHIELDVISCAEEARLAMLGVSPLMDPGFSDYLVLDIGGGSTEVVWARRADDGNLRRVDHVSLPCGVVNMVQRIVDEPSSRLSTYRALLDELEVTLREAEARWQLAPRLAAGQLQVLGASGTVTTLAGMIQGLRRYDRNKVDGSDLDVGAAKTIIAQLLSEDAGQRACHGCVGRQRAELVLPGCAIFEAILNVWPVPAVRVADRGVREGILIDLARQFA